MFSDVVVLMVASAVLVCWYLVSTRLAVRVGALVVCGFSVFGGAVSCTCWGGCNLVGTCFGGGVPCCAGVLLCLSGLFGWFGGGLVLVRVWLCWWCVVSGVALEFGLVCFGRVLLNSSGDRRLVYGWWHTDW
jgi:hypothetical protein